MWGDVEHARGVDISCFYHDVKHRVTKNARSGIGFPFAGRVSVAVRHEGFDEIHP